MVLFHEVFLVRVFSIDGLDWLPQVVIFRVEEVGLRHTRDFHTCLAVIIGREYFGEGVPHPQLPIEGPAHVGLPFVKTAVSHRVPGSRRKGIVAVVTEKLALIFECGLASATHLDGISHTGLVAGSICPVVRRLLHGLRYSGVA